MAGRGRGDGPTGGGQPSSAGDTPVEATQPSIDDPLAWWGIPPLPSSPPPSPVAPSAPGFEAREEGGGGLPAPVLMGAGVLLAVLVLGGGYLLWRSLPSRYWPA